MFGENAEEIEHTVRFSFGVNNTKEEIKTVVKILKEVTSR
jgi:cysteine sulfinate desulfinase/cysteine desulfurase-like protein